MIGRPCAFYGCPKIVPRGEVYCESHRLAPRERSKDERPSSSRRGYGRQWRKLRDREIRRQPFCRKCGRPTTDLDHIKAKVDGGTDRSENLQGLCHSCHTRKTNEERRHRNQARRRRGG